MITHLNPSCSSLTAESGTEELFSLDPSPTTHLLLPCLSPVLDTHGPISFLFCFVFLIAAVDRFLITDDAHSLMIISKSGSIL